MIFIRTQSFRRDYRSLPKQVQQALDKALGFLFDNPRHPSLRARKLPGSDTIWYARIDRGYRFTFQYQDNRILLRRAGTHDILSKERR